MVLIEDIDKVVCYSIGRCLLVIGLFMIVDMGGLDVFDFILVYLFFDLSNYNKLFSKIKKFVDEGNYG